MKAVPNRDKRETLIETSTIKAELLQAEEQMRATEEHFRDLATKKPAKEGHGRQEFKRGTKRTCLLCGQKFSYDLGVHFQGGYICEPCRRDGPPPEAQEPVVDAPSVVDPKMTFANFPEVKI